MISALSFIEETLISFNVTQSIRMIQQAQMKKVQMDQDQTNLIPVILLPTPPFTPSLLPSHRSSRYPPYTRYQSQSNPSLIDLAYFSFFASHVSFLSLFRLYVVKIIHSFLQLYNALFQQDRPRTFSCPRPLLSSLSLPFLPSENEVFQIDEIRQIFDVLFFSPSSSILQL